MYLFQAELIIMLFLLIPNVTWFVAYILYRLYANFVAGKPKCQLVGFPMYVVLWRMVNGLMWYVAWSYDSWGRDGCCIRPQDSAL